MTELTGGIPERKDEERARLIDEIYISALDDDTQFQQVPADELRNTIDVCLKEMEELEAVASPQVALSALSPEIAQKITALWIFSGSGTYDKPIGNDAWKKIPWAEWSDRIRLNYSARLIRKISEMLDPHSRKTRPDEIAAGIGRAKESIRKFGPTLIYNGTDKMNTVARDVLTREGIMMPPEKVHVTGEGVLKTVDQIRTFSLPEKLHQAGKEIGIVSHAPHLVRIARILNKFKPLPSDMKVRFFPIASPEAAGEEYKAMEIRGILYLLYLEKERDATKEPYPYIIHGKT